MKLKLADIPHGYQCIVKRKFVSTRYGWEFFETGTDDVLSMGLLQKKQIEEGDTLRFSRAYSKSIYSPLLVEILRKGYEEKNMELNSGLTKEDLSFDKTYRHDSYPGKLFKLGAIYSSEYRKSRAIDCALLTIGGSYEEIHSKACRLTEVKIKILHAYQDSKKEIHWFSMKPTAAELKRKGLKPTPDYNKEIQL